MRGWSGGWLLIGTRLSAGQRAGSTGAKMRAAGYEEARQRVTGLRGVSHAAQRGAASPPATPFIGVIRYVKRPGSSGAARVTGESPESPAAVSAREPSRKAVRL